MIQLLVLACPFLAAFAAAHDVATFKIPNWVSLAMLGGFILVAPFLLSPMMIAQHVGVGMAALVIGVVIFAFGWIGGGDAKVFAAAAFWMGPLDISNFIVWTAICGGGLALFLLTARQTLVVLPAAIVRAPWVARLLDPDEAIPYGVAIAGGLFVVFPESEILKLALG